jgi:hypothetical protein
MGLHDTSTVLFVQKKLWITGMSSGGVYLMFMVQIRHVASMPLILHTFNTYLE